MKVHEFGACILLDHIYRIFFFIKIKKVELVLFKKRYRDKEHI